MQRITNYRISRAINLVENVFGICASRFRIFRRPIRVRVEVVEAVTKAIVVLRNFLMHEKMLVIMVHTALQGMQVTGERRLHLMVDCNQ